MNASISPKLSFGGEVKTSVTSYAKPPTTRVGAALGNAEYLRRSCAEMRLPNGPRDHHECQHRVSFDQFSPADSDALSLVIQACYRQVFGNCYVMENERAVQLEAQLKDGRLCVREFIRGLAKSDFYISRFYREKVWNRII